MTTVTFKWEKAAEEVWNNRAHNWDKRSMNMWENGSRKDIIPFMEKYLKKGSQVIDIGCGGGYGAFKLFRSGYHAVGVDISEEMISLAKDRLKDIDIPLHQCDVGNMPLEDNQFDGAMLINVLEWTENPAETLLEIKRIIKKDGYLCAGILGPTAGPRANSYRRIYGEEVILNTMMPWEFSQLAEENGFELIDNYGVYKQDVHQQQLDEYPLELKQAVSFMWIFMLKNVGDEA